MMTDEKTNSRGYNVFTRLMLMTTNPDDLPAELAYPEESDYPSPASQADNMRKAFAVTGALIASGFIDVNFDRPDWAMRFQSLVTTIYKTLNETSAARPQPSMDPSPSQMKSPMPPPPAIPASNGETTSDKTDQFAGLELRTTNSGRYVMLNQDGTPTPVPIEEYKARVAQSLLTQAPTLDGFRAAWVSPSERRAILDHLPDGAHSALFLQQADNLGEYDLFDVLAQLGYGQQPLTRAHRAGAFGYKQAKWLDSLPPQAGATIRALIMQFARAGTDALEDPQLMQSPDVRQAGGLNALKGLAKTPAEILLDVKKKMFAA